MLIDRRRLLIAGSAAALTPSGALAQSLPPLPIALKTTSGGILKDRPSVAVGTYGFNYFLASKTSASGGWGAQVALATLLNGLDDATAQRVVDEGHDDLMAQLKAAGLDVVPSADTQAALAAAGVTYTPNNRLKGEGTIDGKSTRKWMAVGAKAAPLIPGSSGEAQALMAAIKSQKPLAKASAALNAVMLNPVMWLDYISIQSSGRRVYSNAASIKSGVRLSVVAPQSSVWPTAANARGQWVGARMDMTKTVESPYVIADRELGAGGTPGGLAAYIGEARGDLVHLNLPLWEAAVRSAYQGYNAAITAEAVKLPR